LTEATVFPFSISVARCVSSDKFILNKNQSAFRFGNFSS
jgi:hypothetical protein